MGIVMRLRPDEYWRNEYFFPVNFAEIPVIENYFFPWLSFHRFWP